MMKTLHEHAMDLDQRFTDHLLKDQMIQGAIATILFVTPIMVGIVLHFFS